MKQYLSGLLIGLVMVFAISSCNFREEMTIQPDGTGKISIDFDGSSIMDMMGDEMAKDSTAKKMDSIIDFAHMFEERKDSIAQLSQEEQEKLKRLENFKMRVLMDPDAKAMEFSMFTEFKNVNELSDMLSTFQDASAIQKLGGSTMPAENAPMNSNSDGTDVAYRYSKNLFSRTTTIVDQDLFEKGLDSLGQMEMFMGESTYTLNYTFPRKIKSISAEEALFSQDGKSFTLEVSFLEMMKNPKILDVEVELEE